MPTRRWLDATRGAGEDLPHALAGDGLAGGHDGECTRACDAECVHRFSEQVLTQHRAEHRLAIAAPSEGRASRTLEMEIVSAPCRIDQLTEQHRAAITETRRVSTELVAGVRLGQRARTAGNGGAHQRSDALRRAQAGGIEPERVGEVVVEHDERRLGHVGRHPLDVQPFELLGERVLKDEKGRGGKAHDDSVETSVIRSDGRMPGFIGAPVRAGTRRVPRRMRAGRGRRRRGRWSIPRSA